MKLNHLSDQLLLKNTKSLVMNERKVIVHILWHLKEIDERKLYSDLKYASLFEYCVKELGYSESSAQRRIVAARALRSMPQLEPKILNGSLSLSTIGLIQKETKNNSLQEKQQIFKQAENKTLVEVSKLLFKDSSSEKKVNIEIDKETWELLQELKNLSPHTDALKVALKDAIQSVKKKKWGIDDKSKNLTFAQVARRPKITMRRALVQNKEIKCSHCQSKFSVEVDHIRPWAKGGKTVIENLRLLCRNCNQRAAIKQGLVRPRSSS